MKVVIRDSDALQAVSPDALAAYARTSGWTRVGSYGRHSDVYSAERLPELVLPRTQRLGDYASVVAQLIEIFARVAERDELSLYNDLVTANRDVVRVRVGESDDGSLSMNAGVDLIEGSRDMLVSVACSLREPQPVYRAGANREANDLLSQMRLAQTEHGSFVVALWTPVVSPPIPELFPEHGETDAEQPAERRLTRRLADALLATRRATESVVEGLSGAFARTIQEGVSANLCEAVAKLITPFPTLDVSITWARTRPTASLREAFRFAKADAPILLEAARLFRLREPKPDVRLFGFVRRLGRDETESDGAIALSTSIGGNQMSVAVTLKQSDYERAIQAHRDQAPVAIQGDLERSGQRWRLLNPRLTDVMPNATNDTQGG